MFKRPLTLLGGCGCQHGHADDGNELGAHYTLFQKIDLENVVCLNEEIEGSGKTVFKPWNERLCRQKVKIGLRNFLILTRVNRTNNLF